jgi:dTDP-4-amino-4,6-dideoxygalactose transaminase
MGENGRRAVEERYHWGVDGTRLRSLYDELDGLPSDASARPTRHPSERPRTVESGRCSGSDQGSTTGSNEITTNTSTKLNHAKRMSRKTETSEPAEDGGIDVVDVYVDEAIVDRARSVLESERYVKGPALGAFEEAFATFCGTEHAVGVSSGTAALSLAMESYGVGPGEEVFVPGHTFFASVSPVLALGATPRFVDCDPETYTIDTEDLAAKAEASDAPSAVVPVHLYGQPAAMDRVTEIAAEHDMSTIEDACQAHGARYRGERAGSLGDVGCFSFYPSKNMTVGGDGGMLVTDDAERAARARELRDHGRNEAGEHVRLGLNYRLDELKAAIGDEQLAHLPDWNRRRREIARRYSDRLSAIPDVRTPTVAPGVEHVFHLYVIDVPDREALRGTLGDRGIGTGIHYPTPAHRHAAIEAELGTVEVLPVTEGLCERIVSLPMHPRLTDGEVDRVCAAIAAHYGHGGDRKAGVREANSPNAGNRGANG